MLVQPKTVSCYRMQRIRLSSFWTSQAAAIRFSPEESRKGTIPSKSSKASPTMESMGI